MTPGEMIDKYLKLRRKVDKLKKAHEEELQPYKEVMGQIEGMLMDHLNQAKLDSVKADAGTAYSQTFTHVTVENWSQTLDWIKENEQWDLLEARVAKNATLAATEEYEAPVPGVKISQARVLRVRSAAS